MPDHADPVAAPRWSVRPCSDADRAAVLDFFSEPDFFFRTAQPDTLSEAEVLDLLGDDTRVLLADGEPVGLYALEGNGSEHGCHYSLALRLRAAAPSAWWAEALREVIRALRWRQELIRLSVHVGEFDARGLSAARAAGLTEEGTLAKVTIHDGDRYGTVFFSQIWAPES